MKNWNDQAKIKKNKKIKEKILKKAKQATYRAQQQHNTPGPSRD